MKKIGFVGGGAIAEAIIKGLLKHGTASTAIFVSDISTERLVYLKDNLQIQIVKDNAAVVSAADLIVLAVKPQNLAEAAQSLAGAIDRNKTIISILAGVTTLQVENILPPESRVVRAMPNTPALVGCGITALTAGRCAEEKDLAAAKVIFESVGSVIVLPEKMMNAVTGLSGSGPAYLYLVIEALADGGVLAGLPRDVALKLAVETVRGAAAMVAETGLHPGQLKDMVTSPAGTTITGLHRLEQAGVRGVFMEAVKAAAEKSELISGEKG